MPPNQELCHWGGKVFLEGMAQTEKPTGEVASAGLANLREAIVLGGKPRPHFNMQMKCNSDQY